MADDPSTNPVPMANNEQSNAAMLQAAQNLVQAVNNLANPVGLLDLPVDIAASGDNIIIPAQRNKVIKVYSMFFISGGIVTAQVKDGPSTPKTGPMDLPAPGANLFLDFRVQPWWTLTAGNAFIINLSGAIQLSGTIYYTQEVPK